MIDIQNLGNGYSYDYIDLVGPGTTVSNGVDNAIGAWLVTPEGTYDVSALAGVESLPFDAIQLRPGLPCSRTPGSQHRSTSCSNPQSVRVSCRDGASGSGRDAP